MCTRYIWLVWLGILIHAPSSNLAPPPPCPLYHFPCSTISRCVSASQVCDGVDDCGDRSDEPAGCTPCNKTYMGELGEMGRVQIPRPRGDKLPFTCFISFYSPPSTRIQVQLERFKLGRFQSSHVLGCPDASLTISEEEWRDPEPGVGGKFCGALVNRTRPIYFSEKNIVTLDIRLYQFWGDTIQMNSFAVAVKFSIHPPKRTARSVETGRLVPGTTCEYKLTNCTRSTCRVQSPNYPGLYNRNISCSYHIYVLPNEIPPGKRGLVYVEQPRVGKIWIQGGEVEKYGRIDQSLGLGQECSVLGDHLTVYDGPSLPGGTAPAVLLDFCRGGQVPRIVSSGPDMLLEMRSSPYSTPGASLSSYTGFELNVGVVFVDDFRPEMREAESECRFTFHSGDQKRGTVSNVPYDLPGNSTCTYSFQGGPGEQVWLIFRSFESHHLKLDIYRTAYCSNKLRLLDGPPFKSYNGSQLGEFCDENPPQVCHNIQTNTSRVCRPGGESYLSTGGRLTLVQEIGETTVINNIKFEIQFEFIKDEDEDEDGGLEEVREEEREVNQLANCDRQFVSVFAGGNLRSDALHTFSSPGGVFFYGRGGRRNLTCSFLIRGSRNERVELNLENISMGSRPCRTVFDAETARYRCDSSGARAGVYISEVEGEGLDQSQCYCQKIHGANFVSASNSILVRFVVDEMEKNEDSSDFFLRTTFRFVERSCEDSSLTRRGGVVRLDSSNCGGSGWWVESVDPKQIVLRLPGARLPQPYTGVPACSRRNRIVVRTPAQLSVICPDPEMGSVQILSPSNSSLDFLDPRVNSILVTLVGHSQSPVFFSWFEFIYQPPPSALVGEPAVVTPPCDTSCPGFGCISPALWCDGVADCPGGWDEMEPNCRVFAPVKLLVGFAVVAGIFVILSTAVLILRLRICSKVPLELVCEQEKRTSNGTLETVLNHKEEVS